MSWVIASALGFIIMEGLSLLLFPDLIKAMIADASPRALAFAGMIESLGGAVLLYIYFFIHGGL